MVVLKSSKISKPDEANRRYTQVWSYGKTRGVDFYAWITSNVQLLADGNRLVSAMSIRDAARTVYRNHKMVELGGNSLNDVVFEAAINRTDGNNRHYRFKRMDLYP